MGGGKQVASCLSNNVAALTVRKCMDYFSSRGWSMFSSSSPCHKVYVKEKSFIMDISYRHQATRAGDLTHVRRVSDTITIIQICFRKFEDMMNNGADHPLRWSVIFIFWTACVACPAQMTYTVILHCLSVLMSVRTQTHTWIMHFGYPSLVTLSGCRSYLFNGEKKKSDAS